MSEGIIQIIVSIIGLIGVCISVICSSKTTQNKISNDIMTSNAIQNLEIEHIKARMEDMSIDVKEHNSYAKQLPEIQGKLDVINEKVSAANKRIDDLESFQKEITTKMIESELPTTFR